MKRRQSCCCRCRCRCRAKRARARECGCLDEDGPCRPMRIRQSNCRGTKKREHAFQPRVCVCDGIGQNVRDRGIDEAKQRGTRWRLLPLRAREAAIWGEERRKPLEHLAHPDTAARVRWVLTNTARSLWVSTLCDKPRHGHGRMISHHKLQLRLLVE